MHSLRRRTDQPKSKPFRSSATKLPLRWAVILMAAAGVGFSVARAAGIVAGITAAVAVAGLLHEILH